MNATATTFPALDIVVPSSGGTTHVRRTLETLRRAGFVPGGAPAWESVEVLVVGPCRGDGSTGGLVRSYPEFRIVAPPEPMTVGRTWNLGASRANGALLLLIAPGTEVDPDAIEALARHLEEHPKAAVVGPRLLEPDGRTHSTAGPLADPHADTVHADGTMRSDGIARVLGGNEAAGDAPEPAGPVDCLLEDVLLFRRAAFDRIGGFDEALDARFGRSDWCRRARHAGWEVHLAPHVSLRRMSGVVHSDAGDEDPKTGSDVDREYRASRRRYLRKHHGTLAALSVDLADGFAALVRHFRSPERQASRDRVHEART